METAKIFTTGLSQAIRLPKAYRFTTEEIAIKRFGNGVLLLPIDNPWQMMEDAVNEFEPGFTIKRGNQEQIEREDLF